MLGKIIGGIAGLAMGGPFGAIVGAAVGHAADTKALPGQQGFAMPGLGGPASPLQQARVASMLGQKEQAFSIAATVLAARLAKADGTVRRAEIDAFKRHFNVAPAAVPAIGRLFDAARDSREPYEPYARQLGALFADAPATLEDVLAALFAIARADGPLTRPEHDFLVRVHGAFGISHAAWDRASGATPRASANEPDPYAILGVTPSATDENLRQTWKRLMRENHPDSLASRGVPPELIARASERVARINAAWDRIKRDRKL
jgi:DnaJ like chaperone protein